MKNRLLSLLTVLCMALVLLPSTAMAAGALSAAPSKTGFVMNNKPVSVTQAYNVQDANYLQLRAIAALLNGTAAQFNVGWDGSYAVIETGTAYTGAATETVPQNTTDVRKSTTKFKLDGTVIGFDAALLIDGDTNYLQLREFAQKLSGTASQFNVYWDTAAGQAVIVPGAAYTGTAQPKNPAVSLYRVSASEMRGQPFRMSAGGDVIGNIPGNTIVEVTSIQNGWAMVKYKGNLYYMWADKLT